MNRSAVVGLSFVALVAFADLASARQMANGRNIGEEHLNTTHPAIADALPVSVPLLRAYPQEPQDYHCNLTHSDGTPGRITLQSIYVVAQGSFSPEVFGGAITRSELAKIKGVNVPEAGQELASYAMRVSGGNAAKALRYIVDAERTDAECASRAAKHWRAQLALAENDQVLLPDARGQWVVARLRPGSAATRYEQIVQILGTTHWLANRMTEGYEAAYARLSQLAAEKSAQPKQREDVATAVRPKAMERAASELESALATAKRYCLLYAQASACRGSP